MWQTTGNSRFNAEKQLVNKMAFRATTLSKSTTGLRLISLTSLDCQVNLGPWIYAVAPKFWPYNLYASDQSPDQ